MEQRESSVAGVFAVECPQCGRDLASIEGPVWQCAACLVAYEVCGSYLVTRGDVTVVDLTDTLTPSTSGKTCE